ncbi:hypothetical protein BaRGS_00031481 [Batillaria attramentaria]|uniref:Uncharacterized protein n=1 Tax=Batillaria attramentaria TaxID=370345 RepID=A0ABD0JQE9_9CAEN
MLLFGFGLDLSCSPDHDRHGQHAMVKCGCPRSSRSPHSDSLQSEDTRLLSSDTALFHNPLLRGCFHSDIHGNFRCILLKESEEFCNGCARLQRRRLQSDKEAKPSPEKRD